MPDIDMASVDGEDSSQDGSIANSTSDSGKGNKALIKKKTRKRGIIYLSTIPPYMNVAKIREIFSEFGEVGRIYLQPSASKFLRLCYCLIIFILNPFCSKY